MTDDRSTAMTILRRWLVILVAAIIIMSAGVFIASYAGLFTGTIEVTVDLEVGMEGSGIYTLYVDGEAMDTDYYYSGYTGFYDVMNFRADVSTKKTHQVWVEGDTGLSTEVKNVTVDFREVKQVEFELVNNLAEVAVNVMVTSTSNPPFLVILYVDGEMYDSGTTYGSLATFEVSVERYEQHTFMAVCNQESATETKFIYNSYETVYLNIEDY